MRINQNREAAWEKCFNELMEYKTKHGTFDLPAQPPKLAKLRRWVNKQRANHNAGKLSHDRFERLSQAGFPWDPLESLWNARFEALAEFERKHGTFNVPRDYEKEPQLAGWLLVQLREFAAGRLRPERTQALEQLGVPLTAPDSWEENFLILEKLADEQGCFPELGPEYQQLKIWLRNQRAARRRNRLSDEQVRRLTGIGIDWEPKATARKIRLAALEAYFKMHGHCNIPESDKLLSREGAWLTAMRMKYRQGALDEVLVAELERLNISWEPWDDNNELMLSRLKQFHEEHGHSDPTPELTDDSTLIAWVNKQRDLRRSGTLQPERVAHLDSLEFIWERIRDRRGTSHTKNNPWLLRYEELVQYKEAHGHANVPSSHRPLGQWLSCQRVAKANGTLPQRCIDLLENLGVTWKPREETFHEYKQALEQFFKQYGHCNIPSTHPVLGRHGEWLNRQRCKKRRGEIAPEIAEYLETLGIAWDPWDELWEFNFEKLLAIKAATNKLDEIEDESLKGWIRRQRSLKARGELPPERQARLEEIGFEWNPSQKAIEHHLRTLTEYFEREGHCNIPYDSPTGNWLYRVRGKRIRGELEDELIAKLESMNVSWDGRAVLSLRDHERGHRFCEHCNTIFQPTHGGARVCSAICYLQASTEVDEVTGCHNWKKSVDKTGRPHAVWRGKRRKAHIFAFELRGGSLPLGMVLRHICNNARCCNPEHLIVGTPAENAADRAVSGSNAGENNPHASLTDKQAAEIFKLKTVTPKPCAKDVADKYGVTRAVIRKIWSGQTYRKATNAPSMTGRPLGANNHSARYSEKTVIAAYSLKGKMTAAAAARKLKVPYPWLQSIWSGRSWSHLTGEKPTRKSRATEKRKNCKGCQKPFKVPKGTRTQTCSIECALSVKVQTGAVNECHIWTGSKAGRYGVVQYRGIRKMAHVLAFDLANPSLVRERREQHLTVSHECHNTLCCNPSHLVLRTREENSALNAGRPDLIGVNAHNSKITEEIARRIMQLIDQKKSNTAIQDVVKMEFNVDAKNQIVDIRRGRSWQHLR